MQLFIELLSEFLLQDLFLLSIHYEKYTVCQQHFSRNNAVCRVIPVSIEDRI